jgi:hypothetical protein
MCHFIVQTISFEVQYWIKLYCEVCSEMQVTLTACARWALSLVVHFLLRTQLSRNCLLADMSAKDMRKLSVTDISDLLVDDYL